MGVKFQNFFLPPCFRGDAPANLTLTECLVGGDGKGGAIGYATQALFLVVAAASFFYVLYGAFQMITAFGDESKFTNGRKTVYYALIGLIIATLAAVIVGAIEGFLRGGSVSP